MRRTFAKRQVESRPVFNGRPNHGLPIGLYSLIFDEFLVALKSAPLDNLPADELQELLADTVELLRVSAAIYDKEQLRENALSPVLQSLLNAPLSKMSSDQHTISDFVITTIAGKHQPYRAFVEIKNEIGEGHSDPFVQCALSYEKYWCGEDVR
jgi:hypothetical protein